MSITLTPSLSLAHRLRRRRRGVGATPECGLEPPLLALFDCGGVGGAAAAGMFSTWDSGRNHAMPAVLATSKSITIPNFQSSLWTGRSRGRWGNEEGRGKKSVGVGAFSFPWQPTHGNSQLRIDQTNPVDDFFFGFLIGRTGARVVKQCSNSLLCVINLSYQVEGVGMIGLWRARSSAFVLGMEQKGSPSSPVLLVLWEGKKRPIRHKGREKKGKC